MPKGQFTAADIQGPTTGQFTAADLTSGQQPTLNADAPAGGAGGSYPRPISGPGSGSFLTDPARGLIPPQWTQDHPVMGDIIKAFDIKNAPAALETLGGTVKSAAGMAIHPVKTWKSDAAQRAAIQVDPNDPMRDVSAFAKHVPLMGPMANQLAHTQDLGKVLWGSLGMEAGNVAVGKAIETPAQMWENFHAINNRATSLDAVTNGASGVHNVIQKSLNTVIGAVQRDAIAKTQQAIQADVAHDKAAGVVGSISTTPALDKGLKALEDVGFNVSPVTKAKMAKLPRAMGNLTLKEAMDINSDLGAAHARAQGSDAKSAYVLNQARQELGKSIGDRFATLGSREAWNYRNRKFEASYDIQRNYEKVLNQPTNPFFSAAIMEHFNDLNLDELKREMRSTGLEARIPELEAAHRDAGIIATSYKTLTNQLGQSLYKMAFSDPHAAAVGLAAYMTAHPVVGLGGYILGTMAGHMSSKLRAAVQAGQIAERYPEPISSIKESGPQQDFAFKSPPPGAGVSAKVGSPSPTPSAAPAAARPFASKGAGSAGMSGARVEEMKAARQARLEKSNKGPLKPVSGGSQGSEAGWEMPSPNEDLVKAVRQAQEQGTNKAYFLSQLTRYMYPANAAKISPELAEKAWDLETKVRKARKIGDAQ